MDILFDLHGQESHKNGSHAVFLQFLSMLESLFEKEAKRMEIDMKATGGSLGGRAVENSPNKRQHSPSGSFSFVPGATAAA